MKKLILFTVIVSAVTLGGLWSGKKFCNIMSMSGRFNQAMYSEMGLDASQTESVRKLETAFRKEVDALCMRICEERANLLKEIKNKRINHEAGDQRAEEIGRLQISLEKKVISHIFQVDKGLTPSQSAVYLERIYQRQCQMAAQSGYGENLNKIKE